MQEASTAFVALGPRGNTRSVRINSNIGGKGFDNLKKGLLNNSTCFKPCNYKQSEVQMCVLKYFLDLYKQLFKQNNS